MKKINWKGIVSFALILSVVLCMLTACVAKLNGTYVNDEGIIKQSFTFEDDNKVIVSAFGIDVEGKYEIKDGTITITYSLLNFSYNMEKSFEKKGDSIFIDGVEFTKEK